MITDEQFEACRIAANESYKRHKSRVRGQMITPEDDWEWHFARELIALAQQEPAQAVEQPRAWPTGEIRLVDRADGCRGHYAIGRMRKSGCVEYWNLRANCWASCSDDVLTLDQAQTLMYSMSPSVAPAQAVPVAEVVWYDPRLTHPDSKRAPHKIIDASLTFFDEAPVGTKLYTAPPAISEPARAVPVAWTDDDYTKIIVSPDIAAAEAANIPLYTRRAPLDSDTRKLVMELCDTIIAGSIFGIITKAKKIRERLEAGE